MATISLYGNKIDSVFQLLGNHENDITKSIAFVLSRCPAFLNEVLLRTLGNSVHYSLDKVNICCQGAEDEGITDVELVESGVFHIVFEAKCGLILPSHEQLQKYANDLNKENEANKYIWTLSDVASCIAEERLEREISGIQIHHISYSEVRKVAEESLKKSTHKQMWILKELNTYLERITSMSKQHSNTVYVVAIKGDSIKEHDKDRTYHCPIGGQGYLKEPENYIGFHYAGRLQYINHVDKVENYKNGEGKMMFKFFLGPDIVPTKMVRTGGRLWGKCYCDIDLLLTSDTILEAKSKTDKRN